MRSLRCLLLASALTLAATRVLAQSADGTSAASAGTITNPAPVVAASSWDISSTLRASVGWRENVTISSVNPINRGFWRAEAESFVIRPIGDHWQFISFLNGDVLRYFNAPQFVSGTERVRVSGEEQWAGDLLARWTPWSWFRTTIKGVGFLEETFIDPSQSEGEPLPATSVRFAGAYTSLAPRLKLPGGFAIEPSLQLKKTNFKRGYNGDYTESRPGVVVEWQRSDVLVLSASWYDHLRHYSHLTASGSHRDRERLLSLRQQEGEVKASSTFETHGKWTASLAGGFLQNRDLVNGFLDYNQKRMHAELAWERSAWRISASNEARRLDYTNQMVGFGLVQTQSRRIADVYETSARVERDLTGKWTVFAENRWEKNRSNINDDPLFRFTYRTNTSLVGIQRTF